MAQDTTTNNLLPAYLIVGDDALKRTTVMSRLRQRLSAMGDLSFNSDVFDGTNSDAASIIAACNTIPFASPVRLVELRFPEKLGKSDSDALSAYFAQPCSTTVVALVSEKLAKNTKLYKAIAALGKTAVIDCATPKAFEMPKLVRSMAVSHGITITQGAANLLVELVGTDTVHLDAELEKIALSHRGSDPVTEHEVNGLVSRTSEVKWWNFVDAMSERNLAKSLLLLKRMPSVTPYELLPRCVMRIRELMCAQSLSARSSIESLAKTLGQPDWKVKNYAKWSRNFSCYELRDALVSARTAEQKMKSGTEPGTAFTDWLIAFLKKQ